MQITPATTLHSSWTILWLQLEIYYNLIPAMQITNWIWYKDIYCMWWPRDEQTLHWHCMFHISGISTCTINDIQTNITSKLSCWAVTILYEQGTFTDSYLQQKHSCIHWVFFVSLYLLSDTLCLKCVSPIWDDNPLRHIILIWFIQHRIWNQSIFRLQQVLL